MLADMQRSFSDWLMHAHDDNQQRLGLGSSRGLTAYQNNYRTQLVHCLKASYPQLLAWLGEKVFLEAAVQHVDRHPPSSWTLDAYGENFCDTLRSRYPHNPDLFELAWIEWSLSEAFVAPDATSMTLDQLADIDWDSARLHLSPSFRQHSATTNAAAIWSALQEGNEPPEAEMLDAPAGLVVWRREFLCQIRPIDAIEHAALRTLRDDGRFSRLCDALVEQLGHEQGVERAGSLLANWLVSGIVVAVKSDIDA